MDLVLKTYSNQMRDRKQGRGNSISVEILKSRLGYGLVFLVVIALPISSLNAAPVAPSTPAISPTPTLVPAKLTPVEVKQLLREFQKAQASEYRAIDHRQKFELKELDASQTARRKEWERKERDARHLFFANNKKGPERRKYIQDFLERRKIFRQLLIDERAQRIHEQKVKLDGLRQDHETKLKEFKETIQNGARPPAALWPRAGT